MKCTRNFLWWLLFLSGFGTLFAILWLSFDVVFGDEKAPIPDKKSGSPPSFERDRVDGCDLGEDNLSADDEYYIYNEFIKK